MGRTEPVVVLAPQAHRKDARAKAARQHVNRTVPAVLASNARARRGVERAELVVDPPANGGAGVGGLAERVAGKGKGKERGGAAGAGAGIGKGEEGKGKAKRRGNGRGRRSASGDEKDAVTDPVTRPERSDDQNRQQSSVPRSPRIVLRACDAVTAARCFHQQAWKFHGHHKASNNNSSSSNNNNHRIGILNMASPLRPGGGFLNGATSHEESLCYRSTLYPSLREDFYRLPEVGGVYSPDVLIVKDGRAEATELKPPERFFVDVVSAGMLRFPEVEEDAQEGDKPPSSGGAAAGGKVTGLKYASAKDRELARRKMRAVMRIFQRYRCGRVVLGAWGCGAYGNPVREVAAAWKGVLLPDAVESSGSAVRHRRGKRKEDEPPERWEDIEEIVFAVKDSNMADEFQSWFGEGITIETEEQQDEGEKEEGEEDPNSRVMAELEARITELRLQASQVQSPHLKERMDSIIGDLEGRLEGLSGGESSHSARPAAADVGSDDEVGAGEEHDDDSEEQRDEEDDTDEGEYDVIGAGDLTEP